MVYIVLLIISLVGLWYGLVPLAFAGGWAIAWCVIIAVLFLWVCSMVAMINE